MASRTTVDLIVQRCAFEVFAAMGVSVAPNPYGVSEGRTSGDDLVGVVQLTLNGGRASMSLCVSRRTLEGASAALGRSNPQDCAREIVNQLAGRIKNRLARYQVAMEMGHPTVFTRSSYSPGSSDFQKLVYVFRTLTEDVQIELSKQFSALNLRYSGSLDIAEEGDVILF